MRRTPPATSTLLDRAAGICDGRGVRLTALRREVLGLVLDSPRPVGAYELLDRLRASRKRAAPPTVYRALDFLLAEGLIHKVERLSAFIGCVHGGEAEWHAHPAQFLICRRCGRVEELEDAAVERALARAARRTGFVVGRATVEADGTCAVCAAHG